MSTPYSAEKQHVLQAVSRAATVCYQVQTEMINLTSSQKADRSPVTVADYASQAVICQALADEFPSDPVVAEETADELRLPEQAEMLAQVTHHVQALLPSASSADVCSWIDYGGANPGSRFWTVDPIDGTKGFLRGEQYAVALALIVNGQVQVGALACPNLPLDLTQPKGPRGVVFLAERGQGAMMLLSDGGPTYPINVASIDEPASACFVESVESGHTDQATSQSVAALLGITRPAVRLDSQAKYGVVARGDAAAYLRLASPKTPHYRERIWDHAAGALIINEAGGRVTDALGSELDFSQGRRLQNNRGIVASNGGLHGDILKAIADFL